MKQYCELLKKTKLFKDMKDEEIITMLNCLDANKKTYKKNEVVFPMGKKIENIGLVLDGKLEIAREDFWGNKSMISILQKGDIFGEAYAFAADDPFWASVATLTDASVLFLKASKVVHTCANGCSFHSELINNLVSVIAHRNLKLNAKVSHMSERSIRRKILSFLSGESKKVNNVKFKITYNRQQLADYLSVDRSALSNELSKLRNEGILNFERNNFELIEKSKIQ